MRLKFDVTLDAEILDALEEYWAEEYEEELRHLKLIK